MSASAVRKRKVTSGHTTTRSYDYAFARYFLSLSPSAALPLALTAHAPRPFTETLFQQLCAQLKALLQPYVQYSDTAAASGHTKRLVSIARIERFASAREHREGDLWYEYQVCNNFVMILVAILIAIESKQHNTDCSERTSCGIAQTNNKRCERIHLFRRTAF